MIENIVLRALNFYEILIIVYILLSWLPASGFVWEVRRVLGAVVEPYLGVFRRFVPIVGMFDISPIVALLVLQWLVEPLLRMVFGTIGL